MKVEDFLSKAVPGQMTVQECIAHAEAEKGANVLEAQPERVTSLTPSGIEVYYQWSPRLYKVCSRARGLETDWAEVPSVTSVLNVLDKSGALTWWGMKVGVEGVLELYGRGVLTHEEGDAFAVCLVGPDGYHVSTDDVVELLTQNKLTVNHVKDAASTRGISVHDAFEKWSGDQTFRPTVEFYPEAEQGYVTGLNLFLDDIAEGGVTDVEAEVMVGSVVHGFAGRFDVRYRLQEPCEVTTRVYPKRKPKREVIEVGRYMKDVKTSKGVYPSHGLQLGGYELASVEDGYEPTDYRAVIHLTADGQYELVRTYATGEDFLSILGAYTTMAGSKAWT